MICSRLLTPSITALHRQVQLHMKFMLLASGLTDRQSTHLLANGDDVMINQAWPGIIAKQE